MMRHCQNSLVSLFSNRWSLCSAVSPSFRLWRDEERNKQLLRMSTINRTFSGQMFPLSVWICYHPVIKSLKWNPESPHTTLQLTATLLHSVCYEPRKWQKTVKGYQMSQKQNWIHQQIILLVKSVNIYISSQLIKYCTFKQSISLYLSLTHSF